MGEEESTDDSHVFRPPEKTGDGMSIERFAEIEKADRDGSPLDVSDEERAKYEDERASLLETMGRFRESLTGTYKAAFQKLGRITVPKRTPFATPAADITRNGAVEAMRRNVESIASYSGISQETLDNMAEAKQLEHEREERNSENIELTAEVMRDMLATMHAQAVVAESRDREAKSAAAKNYWVALGSFIFAALAVVAPFVIEAIKGWD
ncbi:hypothetical protein [Arthrobacter sp. S39]|uniref:hypothetical protein n=1 Tax=Arthrobacter sp. S39 TaxID=2509720 RepID=UPI0010372746|nr:hypothetical protein [Arthrobacter sp. S39]TAP45632.1 hypothetical protein EYS21_02635 [Arthrobacter sp. S39]